MKELDLQNRFDITFKDNSYTFTTNSESLYQIIFVDYSHILEITSPIYMLTIERIIPVGCSNRFDEKTRNSILYIIKEFFSTHENAIISLYDVMDGRQYARKRLFDYWYKQYNSINLVKEEREVCIDEDLKTVATLLYSSHNKNKEELIRGFDKIVSVNFYC